MINIMIVDDHSMIREGLKQLLELDGEEEKRQVVVLSALKKPRPQNLMFYY